MKGVIFDMDGVLIDSMKYHVDSWKRAFKKFNISSTKKDFYILEGMPYKETIDFISKKEKVKISKKEKEEIHKIKRQIIKEDLKIKIYPRIIPFIKKLKKKGLKLALVTGTNRPLARKINREHFKGLFDALVTGEDSKRGKPHPDPYLKALKKLKLNKEEVLAIENAPLGIRSAKGAKLKVLALQTTLPKKELKLADKVFKDHGELIKYLNNFIRQNPKIF